MKKTLTALVVLSGMLIFAYMTRPMIDTPILHARLGQPMPSQGEKPRDLGLSQRRLSQPLLSQLNVEVPTNTAWHDAMADMPRQMIGAAPYRSTVQDGDLRNSKWEALNENSSLDGMIPRAARKAAKEGGHSSRYGKNGAWNAKLSAQERGLKSGHSRFSRENPQENMPRAQSHRHSKFPKLSGEKRLLLNWVRSGKIPESGKRVVARQPRSRHLAKKTPSSHSPSDPLDKAFRFARKKARISARHLKIARRRAARSKSSRQKSAGGKPAISRLLGQQSIRSPQTKVSPPPSPWDEAIPPMPQGEASPSGGLSYADAEQLPPPPKGISKSGKAWISDGETAYYHKGSRWGVLRNGRWGWIINRSGKSFLYLSPDSKPLLQSGGHLWIQNQGALLVYHNGQALGAEELSQWKQDHSVDKPSIRYSADLKRMAIGSTVFNLETGEKL
jgi:hypothetical protein